MIAFLFCDGKDEKSPTKSKFKVVCLTDWYRVCFYLFCFILLGIGESGSEQ